LSLEPTKANIRNTGACITTDVAILHGKLELHSKHDIPINEETQQGINDIMGTLAVNMKVFASALDEERQGRTDFHGGKPSENLPVTLCT